MARRRGVLARFDEVLWIDLAIERHVDFGARIECFELRGKSFPGRAVGQVDLGDDQPVGQDRLLARFRRPFESCESGHGVDQREHHLDGEFAAERAVGREGLQDRAEIGEA